MIVCELRRGKGRERDSERRAEMDLLVATLKSRTVESKAKWDEREKLKSVIRTE